MAPFIKNSHFVFYLNEEMT